MKKLSIEKAFDAMRSANILAIKIGEDWGFHKADLPVLDEYLNGDSQVLIVNDKIVWEKDNMEVKTEGNSLFFKTIDGETIEVQLLLFVKPC